MTCSEVPRGHFASFIGGRKAMLQMQGVAPFPLARAPQEGRVTSKPVFYRETLRSGQRAGQSFSISMAYDDHDRTSASEIINRLYGRRGYGSKHQVLARSECTTFTASCDDEMIGTLSLRVDSPVRLGADETFAGEMADLRARASASVCELTKFAFDPSPDSRPLLAKLFHVIFVYGTQRFACSDLVIEVNPRHVLFYKSMLGFERIGALRTNGLVQAPSQLMHLEVGQIGKNITRFACGAARGSRSLYPYFLGASEEQVLSERIAASISAGQLRSPRPHAEPDTGRRIQRGRHPAQRKRAAA